MRNTPAPPNAIRHFRDLHRPRLSQRQLARAIGIHQQDLSDYELGSHVPTLDIAFSIAKVLGVSVRDVFYGAAEAGENRIVAFPKAKHVTHAETGPDGVRPA